MTTASPWEVLNLTLAFVLELVAVGVIGYWASRAGRSSMTRILFGVGAAVAVMVLWGMFAAPQASFSVPVLAVLTKLVVFGTATLAWWRLGRRALAVAFPLLVIVNLAVIHFGHLSL
ncbi:DUF2568 domain-containing protein [Nocardia sp. SYP-A9097]|uniref:YrdB family protein n=1 Tax=Nocardia sp. SYP-A9097 TaxID=2663237 RepID=UPI00129A66C2|nr:YrdB family protein [Nocardia sp. SYP-A9097]MRH87263.1 DUF2568 domain-containing protein [Nocardia sp. SYP-A9097]